MALRAQTVQKVPRVIPDLPERTVHKERKVILDPQVQTVHRDLRVIPARKVCKGFPALMERPGVPDPRVRRARKVLPDRTPLSSGSNVRWASA